MVSYPRIHRFCASVLRLSAALVAGGLISACGGPREAAPPPQKLWPAPREVEIGSAPKEAITIGIGSVVNQADGTTESFGLLQYFRAHPILVKNTRVRVELIDHPLDAQYSISGSVSGNVGYYSESPIAVRMGGAILVGLGVAPVIPALAMSKSGTISDDVRDKMLVGSGVLAGVGLVTLLAASQLVPSHSYEWNQTASLTLRRAGKKIAILNLGSKGGVLRRDELQGVRDTTLRAIWESLGARVARQIEQDAAEGVQ